MVSIPTSANTTAGSAHDHYAVLRSYLKVYDRYRNDNIIDMDQRLKHIFDFQLYRLDEAVRAVNGSIPAERQSAYWIVFAEQASGEKKIADQTFLIKDGTLFLVPSRTIHSSRYDSLNCKGYLLIFDPQFFVHMPVMKRYIVERKVLKLGYRPYAYLNKEQTELVGSIFKAIEQERQEETQVWKEMVTIKVLELLIYCDRFFQHDQEGQEINRMHPLVEQFKQLLELNFRCERGVSFYANKLNIHPNHLNYLLKRHVGATVKDTINNRIILEAKQLLTNSSLIIKEIANAVGFDDPNNFSTFFQKATCSTPLAYRSKAKTHINNAKNDEGRPAN